MCSRSSKDEVGADGGTFRFPAKVEPAKLHLRVAADRHDKAARDELFETAETYG